MISTKQNENIEQSNTKFMTSQSSEQQNNKTAHVNLNLSEEEKEKRHAAINEQFENFYAKLSQNKNILDLNFGEVVITVKVVNTIDTVNVTCQILQDGKIIE